MVVHCLELPVSAEAGKPCFADTDRSAELQLLLYAVCSFVCWLVAASLAQWLASLATTNNGNNRLLPPGYLRNIALYARKRFFTFSFPPSDLDI